MVHGYYVEKKKGYGDASHVGAGKTLTALGVMTKLLEKMKQNDDL